MVPLWRAYGALGTLLAPLARAYLRRRLARGKEHPTRWPERLGRPGAARPEGRLAWIHAASVGEAMSVLALTAAIGERHPDWRVLLTTGTVTSAALVAERLGSTSTVTHQFAPIDVPGAVRSFLDHWRPDVALRVESELWPTTLLALRRRDIPTALINARMSSASYRGWRRLAGAAANLIGGFDMVIAQSREDADRFTALGAHTVAALGNLKSDNAALPVDAAALVRVRARLADRPVWLAASTHEGEEAIIAEAHRRLAATHPDIVTLIVPRHPARGPAIAREIPGATLRSAGHEPPAEGGLHIADTLGELGLWYRVAPIALIGGSLARVGGHNPLEATRLGVATLMGPHYANFSEMVDEMVAAGALAIIGAEDWGADRLAPALADHVGALVSDPARLAAASRAALAHADAATGAVARVMAVLEPWFSDRQES